MRAPREWGSRRISADGSGHRRDPRWRPLASLGAQLTRRGVHACKGTAMTTDERTSTSTSTGSGTRSSAGRRTRADSILIYGQQKTGTTGMYNTVKQALAPMSDDYFFFFEPTKATQIRTIRKADPRLAVMAKVMAHRISDRFPINSFQRRVMMFRDPRDTLISNLLFKPLVRGTIGIEMANHERFIEALEAKEAYPASISVNELIELGVSLGYRHGGADHVRKVHHDLIRVGVDHDFHQLSYERFVDGDLDDASEYLGLTLRPVSSTSSTWLDHISRSREYGAWRHWFTPADVDHYRPVYAEFLDHFGYGDEWDLAERPHIDPSTSSAHVRASLTKRRTEFGDDRDAATGRGFDLETQFTMAIDGSSKAALAVARHLAGLDRGYTRSARGWARRAELQGSPEASALRIELDEQLAPRRARSTSREPATVDASPPVAAIPQGTSSPPSPVATISSRVREAVAIVRQRARRALRR